MCVSVVNVQVHVLTGKESIVGVERISKIASLSQGLLGEETNEYRSEVHPCCDGDSS